jgi:hypothetical protein
MNLRGKIPPMTKLKMILLLLLLLSLKSRAEEGPAILFIGDSHSYGRMGVVLERKLSEIASRVVMESSCGSTPSTWLGKTGYEKTVCGFWYKDGAQESRSSKHKTPKLADELERIKPHFTIVELGTNIAAAERPENHAKSIKEVLEAIKASGGQCIWIGPPDANSKIVTNEKLQKTNELLKKLTAQYSCSYIDSLALTQFPADCKEGIHYPPKLSAEWGEKLSVEILDLIEQNEGKGSKESAR